MTLGALGPNSDSIRRVGICVSRYFVTLPVESSYVDLVKSGLFSHLTLYPARARARARALALTSVFSFGVAALFAANVTFGQGAQAPLSGNDVSILFPAPKKINDLSNLIALSDLVGPTDASPQRLWPEADFQRFLTIAENPEPAGAPPSSVFKIKLPDEVRTIKSWFIAGIRFDSGAPGLAKEVVDQFGRQPQIRFIVQPVTVNGSNVRVHDIAGHLIFNFSSQDNKLEGCAFARAKPDDAAFKTIVNGLVSLRDDLAAGKFGGVKVSTAGDLNVHPGLVGRSTKPFRDALKALLQNNLSPVRLNTMAIMALDEPEPWIFVSMLRVQTEFRPVPAATLDHGQVSEMFSQRPGVPHVFPKPITNNENPITCKNAISGLPPEQRKGVSTSEFLNGSVSSERTMEIANIIADPKKSHFFNTDWVSCHTETAQPKAMNVAGFLRRASLQMSCHKKDGMFAILVGFLLF